MSCFNARPAEQVQLPELISVALLCFQESKTALYWAVEKGNATMVRDILQCNPDTETCTKVSAENTCRVFSEMPFSDRFLSFFNQFCLK